MTAAAVWITLKSEGSLEKYNGVSAEKREIVGRANSPQERQRGRKNEKTYFPHAGTCDHDSNECMFSG
jgi:hypothetical protein